MKTKKCLICNKEIVVCSYERHLKRCEEHRNIPKSLRGDDWIQIDDNKYECKICHKTFSLKSFSIHRLSHLNNRKEKEDVEVKWFLNEKKNYECSICHKESQTKQGICLHIKYHFGYESPRKDRASWNKGLTKETSESIKKIDETYKKHYAEGIITNGWVGRKHSEATKDKISESMTKYFIKNPDKVPYILNHAANGPSYPEQYFLDLIKNENLKLSYHKQVSLYELDFYNEELKIDLEIDGELHYSNKSVVEKDKRRTDYLESLGWKVIRIRWKDWQSNDDSYKKDFVKYLHSLLD